MGSPSSDTSSYSVQDQIFDASGSARGGQIQVDLYTAGCPLNPPIASDPNGHFMVVWRAR